MTKQIKLYFLWLSTIIIAVFVLQNLPGIPGFTETFILNPKATENFQIYRFITAIFLHGSAIHLLYNLFALLLFGFILEKLIGSKKFLMLFLISGTIANIIALNFYNSSLGASGAIYGILGVIIILRPMMMVWAFGLLLPMFIAGALWIIGDIMGAFGFGAENVGRIAHLSGIAVGLFYGLFLKFFTKKIPQNNKQIEIPDDVIESWENKYM